MRSKFDDFHALHMKSSCIIVALRDLFQAASAQETVKIDSLAAVGVAHILDYAEQQASASYEVCEEIYAQANSRPASFDVAEMLKKIERNGGQENEEA